MKNTMNKLWRSVRDLSVVTRAFLLVIIVSILLAVAVSYWLRAEFPLPADSNLKVLYLEQYVALIKVIAVGVFVALVSVIIPLILPEARDKFERYKESRQAYSRAKTSVIYLPDRVANEGLEKAAQLVEAAHRELHLAETFIDVIVEKGYLKWFANPDLWVIYNYWQIVAVAEVSRKFNWSNTEGRYKLHDRLRDALEVVHNRFGRRGEFCAGEKWELEDGSRFKEEDKLKADIMLALNGPEPEVQGKHRS